MKTVLEFLFCGVFVFAVVVSSGCSPDHVYQYREFESQNNISPVPEVSCNIRMEGTFINQPNRNGKRFTISGNPYNAFIWFETDSADFKVATINSVKYILASGRILDRTRTLKTGEPTDLFDPRKKGTFEANFLFREIELPRERCGAEIEVIFELRSGEKIPATYSIELIPSERTEESVDWWDNIMSV